MNYYDNFFDFTNVNKGGYKNKGVLREDLRISLHLTIKTVIKKRNIVITVIKKHYRN